jgi:hypothetical protein
MEEEETADLSTALRSGRDDDFVRQMATNCKPRNILNLATNLSLDRSVAQWRDLRFCSSPGQPFVLLPRSLTRSL